MFAGERLAVHRERRVGRQEDFPAGAAIPDAWHPNGQLLVGQVDGTEQRAPAHDGGPGIVACLAGADETSTSARNASFTARKPKRINA